MTRTYSRGLSQKVYLWFLMIAFLNAPTCLANNQIYTKGGHSEITQAILNGEEGKAVKLIESSQKPEWFVSWKVFREVAEPPLRVANLSGRNHDKQYPLLAAVVASGHISIAKALIKKGAHVDSLIPNEGSTPLMFASKMHDLEMVKLLLSKNADPSILTSERISTGALAFSLGHMESGENELVALELLKSPYGELILSKSTPLQIRTMLETASYNGLLQVIQRFNELGVKLLGRNRLGATLLHYALMGGEVSGQEVALYLIQQGLDPNQHYATNGALYAAKRGLFTPRDRREGKTPLLIAIDENASNEFISKLLVLGANVNMPSLQTITPVDAVIEKKRNDLIDLFENNRAAN